MSVDVVKNEGRIRYRAAQRGFRVMRTRGLECKRRQEAGAGIYVLFDQATNVVLPAATLADIAEFLQDRDRTRRRQLH